MAVIIVITSSIYEIVIDHGSIVIIVLNIPRATFARNKRSTGKIRDPWGMP
jgi:hypothetical protein